MFAAFKKEIMIVVFSIVCFLLGSSGPSNEFDKQHEELWKEEDKNL